MKKTKNNNKIKALILDVGGILQLGQNLATKHGVHETIAKKLGISLDQYMDSIDTSYASSITGEIPEKKALETIAHNLNISIKKLKNLYTTAYRKVFKFNKPLFKKLLKIKKQGYKVAILSDQWYLSEPVFITKKIRKAFSPIIISCDVGMRKPEPKIYKLTLKKLHLKSSQVIFIDNQQWNIKPAQNLGMHTILYKNNEQLFKQLSKQGIKS